MTDTYFPLESLQTALSNGSLILTANNRLRNHFLRSFAQSSQTAGGGASFRPRVMTLQQWFEQTWETLQWASLQPRAGTQHTAHSRVIIGNLQRQALWQSIIESSSLACDLLQPAPLAQSADAALRSLELWQLDAEDIRQAEPWLTSSASTQSNSHNLLQWLASFRARLHTLQMITQEQAMVQLISAYESGSLTRETDIWLLGFDDIPPLHQQLISVASHHHQQAAAARAPSTQLQRTQCASAQQEMLAAARWSQAILARNPEAMIGIIAPNLGQCRAPLERAFTAVFEPLAALPDQPRFTLPFNFSAGTPLGSTPLIAASLELLRLYQQQWPLEDICQLLLSPFWGQAEAELGLRSQLVNQLRQLGRFHIHGSDLRYWAQRLATRLAPGAAPAPAWDALVNRLLHLENQMRASFGQHSCRHWSDLFSQLLQQLDWPGERCLDSQEHQQLAQWSQLLEEFSLLDACGLTFTYTDALQQLRQIASKTPFQAQTPLSPIQILGALEGSGLVFSHCWVMGLHHRQWPAVAAPNPLLPINLQRQQQMPHASAERELVFASSLTRHYRQCAREVVVSSASQEDDQTLSASALIRDIPLTPLAQLLDQVPGASDDYWQQLAQASQLDALDDSSGPAVVQGETIRGGASIFKEQAACPFNAFARLRLGARGPELPQAGFSALERGNMLHNALADIWRQLQSQQGLCALSEPEIQTRVQTHADKAVADIARLRGPMLSAFYVQLEQERLRALLETWLVLERERPDFTVIAIEEPIETQFAGIPLSLRIDRIDRFEQHQELLLIDYKTGHPNTKAWFGERMDEPQLPLYALVQEAMQAHAPEAIAFAQINVHGCEWKGVGQLQTPQPGIAPLNTWPAQIDTWKQQLSQLAEDFLAGAAAVDFKDTKAQAYAEDLAPLNRAVEAEAVTRYWESRS